MINLNLGNLKGQQLDSGWGLLPDPMNRCRAQKWWKSVRKENFWFPSYDDDAFWPTKVPGAFNCVHDELKYYEGNVVYINHFSARKCSEGEKAFLHFEGIAEHIAVFLNGIYLGEHEGGYVPVTFDATRAVDDHNRLLILCENNRDKERVPGVIHDWWHDGGIIRPVSLHYRPETYIRDLFLRTELNEHTVKIHCGILIDSPSRDENKDARVKIIDGNNEICSWSVNCRPGSWSETVQEIPLKELHLWFCEQPYLYQIEVCCGRDVWTDETGFRKIRTKGRQILLNNQPVILRGIATWTDDPACGLFSMTCESASKTVSQLQELNCNFARAGHRPNSLAFSRACDKAGILLWMEVPAYWIPDMQKAKQSRIALQTLEAAICEFRNSPSVIIWSVGNECLLSKKDEEQSNLAYFIEAADFAHLQDPSRLVAYTGGMEGAGNNEKMDEICPQPIVEKLDVIGFNSYSGINDSAVSGQAGEFKDQYEKARFASSWGKPVIHAEAGIDGVLGEQGTDFGEQRQADYHAKLQTYFADCIKEGTLQGMAIFVLNDFRTPIKLGRFQGGFNRKGLIDEKDEHKKAFDIVKRGYYSENKEN
jgi:beta-glucuronidase